MHANLSAVTVLTTNVGVRPGIIANQKRSKSRLDSGLAKLGDLDCEFGFDCLGGSQAIEHDCSQGFTTFRDLSRAECFQ